MQEPIYPWDKPAQDTVAYADAMTHRRKTASRTGLCLGVLLSVTVIMQYVVYFLLLWVYPAAQNAWWTTWVLSIIPLYGFGLPAFLGVMKRMDTAPHHTNYHRGGVVRPKPPFTVRDFLLLTVIGFGLLYVGNFLGSILMGVLSNLTGHDYQNSLSAIADNSPFWMVFLGTVIIAPMGEEFLFRKLLIDRTRGLGDATAILLSATFFALFHGNFFQFFYAFLLGLVLGYMYTWSGQWLWGVGLHTLINLVGGIIMPFVMGQLNVEGDPLTDPAVMQDYMIALGIELVILALILLSVVLVIRLVTKHRIYIGKSHTATLLTREDSLSAILGNLGMVMAVVLYVAYMAMSLLPA